MTLPDEFEFIDRLRRLLPARPDVVEGVGDDAAVLPGPAGAYGLFAADMLVEGRHFFPSDDLYDVGRKALAVNVSDVAAMGGRPTYAVVSLGVPDTLSMAAAERLYTGLREEGLRHRVAIVGGDTVAAPVLTVSVALLGEVERDRLLLRKGALVGDKLCVTGRIGAAAAGLLLRQHPELNVPPDVRQRLLLAHTRPVARVEAGRDLSRGIATAAIDVSDGIAGDLRRLCRASDVGAVVDADALPVSDDVRILCEAAGADPVELALTGGEDFELLFTVRNPGFRSGKLAGGKVSYTVIGEIVPRDDGLRLRRAAGIVEPMYEGGYVHF